MDDDSEEERRGIVRWLLDVRLGRRTVTEDEERGAVYRLGALSRRQRKSEDATTD
jgi:hypothetical protein